MVILSSSLVSLPPASSPTKEEWDRLAAGREAFLVSSSNSLGTGYRYSSDSVPQVFCRDVYIHTLEEGMTTHSSVLAWRIPWTGGAWQATSMGLQRVSHNWAISTYTHTRPCLCKVCRHVCLYSLTCVYVRVGVGRRVTIPGRPAEGDFWPKNTENTFSSWEGVADFSSFCFLYSSYWLYIFSPFWSTKITFLVSNFHLCVCVYMCMLLFSSRISKHLVLGGGLPFNSVNHTEGHGPSYTT